MNLTPTEMERLLIFSAARFAERNRADGIALSHPEAVAFISDWMLHAARRGLGYAEIVDEAGRLLTLDDVEPGVASMIPHIVVEGNFTEGTKMMVVFNPIGPGLSPAQHAEPRPGEVLPASGEIELAPGRARIEIEVFNSADRDIQVRSHTHFFEVNRALLFDREKTFGFRLDLPSGVGVRFEPGIRRRVALVAMGGSRAIHGAAGLVEGALDDAQVAARAMGRARERGYLPAPAGTPAGTPASRDDSGER
ncbi:urease subunit beta [Propylenella binzhouense]|uniref:urease n=1 Tax=Propylenella binzhouense TaxID=2555902 RepID=A0A964T0S1_9HYPH|nr:urease subunit beta [Propylenella binzhouense]MYZ46231.1 urease subunit beta [Propylenella binzhouense]